MRKCQTLDGVVLPKLQLMIHFISNQNILDANVEAIVNPVNCVGTMGKGLAREIGLKFPRILARYQSQCRMKLILPGVPYAVRVASEHHPNWIINFPTKDHWRNPSQIEWIWCGMDLLVNIVILKEINSIAIPALGCGNGGLSWEDVRPVMVRAMSDPGMKRVNVLIYEPHRSSPSTAQPAAESNEAPPRRT